MVTGQNIKFYHLYPIFDSIINLYIIDIYTYIESNKYFLTILGFVPIKFLLTTITEMISGIMKAFFTT